MTRPPEKLVIEVSGGDDGRRLDALLGAAPGIGSRASAQRLIAAGAVLVDGRRRGKNHRLSRGNRIEVRLLSPRPSRLIPEEMALRVPYGDEHLLVVDKPAGLVTHPARGHATGTLVQGLLGRGIGGGGQPQRPGIVHRLDRDTSGLLIVARDEETHRRLASMLSRHQIQRTYLALVHGRFPTREGTVRAPVGRDPSHRQRMAVTGSRGKEAVTHFRVLHSWAGPGAAGGGAAAGGGKGAAGSGPGSEGYSLLEVRLETGRTHQIRVHLAAIGHPVAGDRTYGRRRDSLDIGRQFLHAARLRFRHPVTGEIVEVESPLPPDLAGVLQSLSGGTAGSGWRLPGNRGGS